MVDAHIVGWGHTRFGRLDGRSLEDLIVEAVSDAIDHAAISAVDVDAIWIGNFNNGLTPDGFASSLALQADPRLRFVPATRVENACASGSAAIYAARESIRAGTAKIALVIGAEKMTARDTPGVTKSLSGAGYQPEEAEFSFPQIFARFARAYFDRYGDRSDALATIAAKNHANAVRNPLAHLQRPLSEAFCRTVSDKNPMVAAPLRMSDCSLISDGAAAVVLAADDLSAGMRRAVRFRSAVQVNDFLPMSRRDLLAFEGPRLAFAKAFAAAGISVQDLDLAEVHDCFTIAELLIYEAMGLAEPGCGAAVVEDGTVAPSGRLPVNLSGGLKAKGHPVGATGVSMHVMAARQLVADAGEMQKRDATLACVFNMGGSGVANYCSILERAR